jgi:hypothetical protein
MKTTSKKATSSKPPVKVKPLTPRKAPKGGRRGGDCDEFGCGMNHNHIVETEGLS